MNPLHDILTAALNYDDAAVGRMINELDDTMLVGLQEALQLISDELGLVLAGRNDW